MTLYIPEPGWLQQLVEQGRNAGRALLACEAMVGHEVILLERHLIGAATLESVAVLGDQVDLRMRILPWHGSTGQGVATLRYKLDSLAVQPWSVSMSAGYGIDSELIFHPAVIAHITKLALEPDWRLKVLHLMRLRTEWPQALLIAVQATPGLPAPAVGQPRCQVQHGLKQFVAELRDLPLADGKCMLWPIDHPVVAVMAVCGACLPLAPDLMQHLLRRDRAHRAINPSSLPTVAADADELFAHRPDFAMLYHQPLGDVSLNGNMGKRDAIRLLTEVGLNCGFLVTETQTSVRRGDLTQWDGSMVCGR